MRRIIPFIVLVCSCFSLQAQNNSFSNKGRGHTLIYLGYNHPMSTLTHTMNDSYFDPFTGSVSNTEIKKKYEVAQALGATIGWSLPFTPLGEVSALAADLSVIYNDLSFETGKVEYGSNQFFDYEVGVTQLSIPIGISLLRGPDAVKDKSYKLAYGIGLGVAPTQTSVEFGQYDNAVWNIHPYARAEFGFFAGILFKIRAHINFGNTSLFDLPDAATKEPLIGTTKSQLESGTTTNVQFIIYPFSGGFADSKWWTK